MTRFLGSLITAALLLAGTPRPASAQESGDPSDQFLKAYMAAQQAEKLEREGKLKPALTKFRFAASMLDEISRQHPGWQPLVVQYRARKTADSITRLQERVGMDEETSQAQPAATPGPMAPPDLEGPLPTEGTTGPAAPTVSVSPLPPAYPPPAYPPGGGDSLEAATRAIREKMAQLETDLAQTRGQLRTTQQERLQLSRQLEATAAQLQETAGQLDRQKLNEAELKSQLAQVQEALKSALTDDTATKEMEDQVARLKGEITKLKASRDAAEEENEEMAERLFAARRQIALLGSERETIIRQRDQALGDLAKAREAQQKLEQVTAEKAELIAKLATAEETIKQLKEQPDAEVLAAGLREELRNLKQQLADAQQQTRDSQTIIVDLRAQLDAAKVELVTLRAGAVAPAELKKLTEENELLRGIVERELKDQARREQSRRLVFEELSRLEVQSNVLLDQLDLLAQPVVRLTERELALFKDRGPEAPGETAPDVTLAIAAPKKEGEMPGPEGARPTVETASAPAVPPELEPLAKEAREHFEMRRYADAENAYEKILTEAPNNIYALSNLGVVRFRAGKLKAAELTFKKAIAVAPEDSFAHSTLGIVYYRQGKFDEAINVLTKAITINPKNAVAHNYLGITASQKGWQEAAEKEMQSAIAINPNYADAHFNLAVIYASAQPPSKEMARHHYRTAISLGAESDPALEKLIE